MNIVLKKTNVTKLQLNANDKSVDEKSPTIGIGIKVAFTKTKKESKFFKVIYDTEIQCQFYEAKIVFECIFECNVIINEKAKKSKTLLFFAPAIGLPLFQSFLTNLMHQCGFPPISFDTQNLLSEMDKLKK